ncbi:MAG: ATP-grasp domain-containing protein [Deltaproteobacteria bacterium]
MTSTAALPSAILVHEYVTGGGWQGPSIPSGLAREALAILRALLADLRTWGRFTVVTTRDRRLPTPGLDADRIVDLDHAVYPGSLLDLGRACGAALVVAPESGGALERVSALLAEAGVLLLGSPARAVAVAADKWECHRRFVRAGLPTPPTICVTPAGAEAAAARLGHPVVVKPLDGAGCDGVSQATDARSLRAALRRPALSRAPRVLVQRYVEGQAASVSLLVARGRSIALSLNGQHVRAGARFAYDGGVASLPHPRSAEARELARRAVALVPDLCGYVGVDLVLGEDGCWLIEINPRPTTSYVGLRRVIGLNMSAAVWDACRDGVLPDEVAAPPPAAFGSGWADDA